MSETMPDGWDEEGMKMVQGMGYSMAGVHNLRPKSNDWTPAELVEHTAELTPYVLDPMLMGLEEMYKDGTIEAHGFVPTVQMYEARVKNLNTKKEMPSGKSSRAESGKRRERESSESSGAGSSRGQNPKPPVAEGGTFSYVLPIQPLLEHSNNSETCRAILDNRLKTLGGSVTGTIVVNDADPPRIYSATQRNSSSRCTRLYNPQGNQKSTMVRSKLLEDAAVRPNEYKAWCD